VAFDLGNVMIYWDPRLLYRKLLPGEPEVEHFLGTVCTPEWNHRLDAGLPLAEGIAERIERFPEHETLIRAYGERFGEMMLPMPASIALLEELKTRSVPLFALSNWNADTFERTRSLFPFLGGFDGLVISGAVGRAKPDPGIYRHLLDVCALPPEEILFVDDRVENVEAGRALGIRGHLFEGPEALRRELTEHGLL
jgi:HAD superfamily hydrolase (TIGR01509 family)